MNRREREREREREGRTTPSSTNPQRRRHFFKSLNVVLKSVVTVGVYVWIKREKIFFCKAFQDPRGLVKNLFLKRYLEDRLLGPSQRLGHKNRLKAFKIFERLVKNLGLDQEEQLQLDFATLCFTLAAIVAFRWGQESPSSPETVFRWSSKVSSSTADSGWEF